MPLHKPIRSYLQEICFHCGKIYGSHHAGISPWPRNYCPDPDERMDWANGPGTTFEPTGRYKDEEEEE